MLRASDRASLRPWRIPALYPSGDIVAIGVSALVALEIGAGVAMKPAAALLPVALLAGILLLVDARSGSSSSCSAGS